VDELEQHVPPHPALSLAGERKKRGTKPERLGIKQRVMIVRERFGAYEIIRIVGRMIL